MELKSLKVAEMSRAEKQETKGGNPILYAAVVAGCLYCGHKIGQYVKGKVQQIADANKVARDNGLW